MIAIKGKVEGRVQGVGFRYFTQHHAIDHGISGYAMNRDDGSVEFYLVGDELKVNSVLAQIKIGPKAATVSSINWEAVEFIDVPPDFVIG